MVKDLEGMKYEDQLMMLGLLRLEETERCYLYKISYYIKSFISVFNRHRGADLFVLVSSDKTQENCVKLHQERYKLDIRKYFFTERVYRLPTVVVMAPSLLVFKKYLVNSFRYMV